MSFEDWKKEFYPIHAEELKDKSWLECTQHSLQKWKGVLPENLEKYNLVFKESFLVSKTNQFLMAFNSTTCSLCIKAEAEKYTISKCKNCAMLHELEYSCDYKQLYFKATSNPQLLVDTLQQLVDKLEKKDN